MVRAIKDICKVRDILASGDDKKISNPRYADASGLYETTAWKIRDVIKKKSFDPDYEIDITSQDLRELAKDIKAVFHRWEETLDADTNIKEVMNSVEDGKVDMNKVRDKFVPVMVARVNTSRYLVGLLNIAEYMAVFLYALEDALCDEFALKYTERLPVDKK